MNMLSSGAHAPGSLTHRARSLGASVRTLITLATIVMMLFGGLALTSSTARADAGTGATSQTTDNLNLRAAPSLDAEIFTVIPAGGSVTIDGAAENGFYPVTWQGQNGYAYGDYLTGVESGDGEAVTPPADQEGADSEEPAASVPVGDAATGVATVFDGRLNLRSGPGTSYDVVTVLPDGASVELRGEAENGFYPLSYDGMTGWASAEWLQIGGEEPVDPAPTEPVETEEPAPTEPPATDEPVEPPVDGSDGYTEDEVIQIIYNAAAEYGQSGDDMLRVARCESVLDPNAVNASSNASGLFQFLPSTWATTPYADQDIFDPQANAEAAAWMWANGRRNEWVCQ